MLLSQLKLPCPHHCALDVMFSGPQCFLFSSGFLSFYHLLLAWIWNIALMWPNLFFTSITPPPLFFYLLTFPPSTIVFLYLTLLKLAPRANLCHVLSPWQKIVTQDFLACRSSRNFSLILSYCPFLQFFIHDPYSKPSFNLPSTGFSQIKPSTFDICTLLAFLFL